MTNDQINAAIAEACGWTKINVEHRSGINPTNGLRMGAEFFPKYVNDLNAMHEAEKTILDMHDGYGWALCKTDCITLWHATARQRAEAFLRTLDKWEEAVVKEYFTTEEETK